MAFTRPLWCWIIIGAAAWPAVAAPRHYAIGVEQVWAAISQAGTEVKPGQVTLLTNAVATVAAPSLKVRSIQRAANHQALVRLECESPEECVPFFVGLRPDQTGDTRSGEATERPASLNNSGLRRQPGSIVIRTGSPATLLLESDRVHIRIPVVSLENGAPGQTIRAAGKDRRKIYAAQVLDSATLKGAL